MAKLTPTDRQPIVARSRFLKNADGSPVIKRFSKLQWLKLVPMTENGRTYAKMGFEIIDQKGKVAKNPTPPEAEEAPEPEQANDGETVLVVEDELLAGNHTGEGSPTVKQIKNFINERGLEVNVSQPKQALIDDVLKEIK